MPHSSVSRVFGKRSKQHTIILASGDEIRHWTIRPWMLGLAASFLAVTAIGYLLGTTYLVLRDDLIGASMARQARMQHAYEDRIASLRSQVDRITSRQLLDQQLMDDKMTRLMEQQAMLSTRHGRLDMLLKRADVVEFVPAQVPVPTARPENTGNADVKDQAAVRQSGKKRRLAAAPDDLSLRAGSQLSYAEVPERPARQADEIFNNVLFSLQSMEQDQLKKVRTLTSNAYQTAETIHSILGGTGVSTDADAGVGGPFIGSDKPAAFDATLNDLGAALDTLEQAKQLARKIPVGNPVPNHPISSRFGQRRDPFLKRLAHHAGVDFKTAYGQAVLSTGAGKVVKAGRKGGYGKMVEIDHGNGVTTRYAHLSRILVKVGDAVDVGAKIGATGSTGRSTGPHLHYEVRINDNAVNPQRFLTAGKQLQSYL
ncbi:M23 family metallopeptidase [Nitratireductor sp. XY-223]|uniref:M23 family metallopeptidase n=1 Tax=Nitratireductor sp. XY-223 TaxID=2561926 RepID=UPI001FEE7FF8|nr:M23 family metallopeptidase [Nitratireductor sp. XY-223]